MGRLKAFMRDWAALIRLKVRDPYKSSFETCCSNAKRACSSFAYYFLMTIFFAAFLNSKDSSRATTLFRIASPAAGFDSKVSPSTKVIMKIVVA